MAETQRVARSTAYQGTQFSKELAPGAGGSTYYRAKNMEVQPTPDIPVRLVRYQGSKANVDTQVSQSMANMSFSGVLDFNLLPLILDSMFSNAAPTTPGSAGGRQRVWNPSPVTPTPMPDTLVLEHGSSRGLERMNFMIASGITMRTGKDEAAIEGNMFGRKIDRNQTITAATGIIAPRAVHSKNISWFVSTDGSTYTKLRDVRSGELNLNGLWGPNFHQDDEEPSYDEIVEMMPDFGGTITVDEGPEADVFQSALENSTLLYLGMKATGRLLEAGTGILDPTSAPYVKTKTTGGTLAAGTHYVKVAYKNATGLSKVTPATSFVTTGSTSSAVVSVGALPANATAFNVYYSSDGVSYALFGTSTGSNTYLIVTSATVTTAAHSTNTSGTVPIYELIRVNLPVLVTAPDPGDKDGVYGNTFTFSIGDDETFGLASVTVVNGVASYG